METIIVDDEEKAIEMLEFYLSEYFPSFEVIGTYMDIESAIDGILKNKPEILFLDINMPSGTGIELLSRIKHLNILTIFLTAHSEYAIEAIKLDAFDYLLKPLNLAEFNRVNAKILDFKKKPILEENKIKIQISNNIYLFNVEEIILASSEGNYTTIFSTSQKPLVLSKNLKKVQEEYFSKLPFYRSHQSYIVNLNHIVSYSNYEIILTENHKASLSNKKFLDLSNLIS